MATPRSVPSNLMHVERVGAADWPGTDIGVMNRDPVLGPQVLPHFETKSKLIEDPGPRLLNQSKGLAICLTV